MTYQPPEPPASPAWNQPPTGYQPPPGYPPPPGYGAPYQQPPKKKRHVLRWILLAVVVVIVIIIIVSVASSGGGKKGASSTATTSAAATSAAVVAPAVTVSKTTAAAPPPATAKTVLTLAGSGQKQSADFTVTQDQWTIAYTYNCANFGGQGNFMIDIYDKNNTLDFNKPGVNELGASGNSSTVEHGNGTYYLSINSECTWTVKVTG